MESTTAEQMAQAYTAYASMVPALIQQLVVQRSLTPQAAAKLFRDAEQLMRSGPAQGGVVSAGVEGLQSMAEQMEAIPDR